MDYDVKDGGIPNLSTPQPLKNLFKQWPSEYEVGLLLNETPGINGFLLLNRS